MCVLPTLACGKRCIRRCLTFASAPKGVLCLYIYIYIYICSLCSLVFVLCIYIYIYVCIHNIYIHIHIYKVYAYTIYIYTVYTHTHTHIQVLRHDNMLFTPKLSVFKPGPTPLGDGNASRLSETSARKV